MLRELCCTFILLMFLTCHTYAQQTDPNFIREHKLTPPGTAYLKEQIYLDETELTNIAWLEFLFYIKRDSSKEYYQSMLPDTLVWERCAKPQFSISHLGADSSLDFTNQYLRYPGYRYYPVVGISFHQANIYCQWRSKAVTDVMNKRLADKNQKIKVKYNYFLPSEQTLAFKAVVNHNKKVSKQSKKRAKKIDKNFDPDGTYWNAAVRQSIGKTESGKEILISGINWIGYGYEPHNNEGYFYGLIGNVSEMTDKAGISFGGSWIHRMEEINALKTFPYQRPEYWLGFRCACTVTVEYL